MKTVYIKGIREPGGAIRFDPPNPEEEGVRYIIRYMHNGICVEQTYHPFWLMPKSRPGIESYRMTLLDFSKDGKVQSNRSNA